MRLSLMVVVAAIATAACSSTPTPTPRPKASQSAPASPSASPAPSSSPIPSPSSSPAVSVITEQVGHLLVTHPAAWDVVPGPEPVQGRPVPLFYLSDVALSVGPCPPPDATTGDFQACPGPLAALPAGAVLVTVDPNLGVLALNPPRVDVRPATASCEAIGGQAQMSSVVRGTVVTACLRGPDLASQEADVRAVIVSLRPAR